MTLSEELSWRGLINQTTLGDLNQLDQGSWVLYCGFDASAASQTIGNLATLLAVKAFSRHGHKVILLAGGATSLIGDPGGKTSERQLLDRSTVEHNINQTTAQFKQIMGNQSFTLVNNLDWIGSMTVIDFLRDVGKHFPVGSLIKRDYINQRLGQDGTGISYTEFSYTLLQGYDYLHLYQKYDCRLQIGGADQWGNCLSGVDLIGRVHQQRVEALTLPLIINQATGHKFGKSEAGPVWLDPNLTSPYDLYQVWLNVDDQSVESYLKIFTEFNKDQIDEIIDRHQANPSYRQAQKELAGSVVELIHGADQRAISLALTDLIFADSAAVFEALSDRQRGQLLGHLVSWQLEDLDLLTILVDKLQLADSRRQAREFLASGALKLINRQGHQSLGLATKFNPAWLTTGWSFDDQQFVLIKRGKNKIGVIYK